MKAAATPLAISKELGNRLRQARLNLNLTQDELGKRVGLGRKAVVRAEQGKITLINFVSLMVAMNLDQSLDQFLPPQLVSPLELLKLQGRQRQRASGGTNKESNPDLDW